MIETILNLFSNKPLLAALAAFTVFVGVGTAIVRAINALREWIDRSKTRILANTLMQSTGVASFTADDISYSCKNYIQPNCTQTDPSDEDDLQNVVALAPLFKTIDNHIDIGGEKRHVILLADSGMGKTSFCINYYAREAKKPRDPMRKIAIVPLGRGDAFEQIGRIPDKRNTICFLDAFDEDPGAVNNQRDHLAQLMNASADFKNVIITCRSQFFSDDDSIPKGSGVMYAGPRKAGLSREFPLHKLFLAPLTRDQIGEYLRRNFPYRSIENWKFRQAATKLVATIPELSVRPMLLELLPDLVRDKLSITQLFGLYKLLVEKWLQRERDWIQEEELLNISMEIAVVLFIQQRAGKGDRISSSQLELIASNHSHPLEAWKLKSRSLLNRDIRGDYKFAHRSVMEYLFLQSAICGDVRCFGVEWTDFMKDLLVSWGNTDANSSKEATKEFFKNDLGATGLFPLASPLKTPYRRSSGECKSVLRNEYISNRHTRNIPVSWRNNYLEVKKLASTGEVYAYQITDPTHGLVWLINDTSRLVDSDERDLYRDSFYLHDSDSVSTNQAIRGKRLPSIEELITLWESEAYLQNQYGIKTIFSTDEIYWIGDTTDSGPICCSFGNDLELSSHLKHISTRRNSNDRKFHLYEFTGNYGMLNRKAFKAMCVYLAEITIN